MADSIEELNAQLKAIKEGRDPAQTINSQPINVDGYVTQEPPTTAPKLSYGAVKEIFPTPAVAIPDPSKPRVPATSYSSEKIVGGKDPDYSGYDKLIEDLRGIKPKDTSMQDLIAMGISTGVGAMYGQVGAAAKVAGKYGMDQATKQDKQESDFLKQLNALRLARAQQMAKGVKGQKVKSGAGSSNWRSQIRVGSDGRQYWMTNVDPNTGKFMADEGDQAITPIQAKTVDIKRADGSLGQAMVGNNLAVNVGEKNAPMSFQKNTEGQTKLVNPLTGEGKDIGGEFNQTSMNLTPDDQKTYDTLRNKKMSDDGLNRVKASYDDIVTGATALGRGDLGNMKVSLKMLASALEKGRMTSDADLHQVSDMNMGLVGYFEKKLAQVQDGDIGIDQVRKEMESAYSTIQATARDAYKRRLGTYNDELKRAVHNRPDLEWKPDEVPQFGSKKQSELINKSISTARDLVSTAERVDYFRDAQGNIIYDGGKPVRAKFIRDPQTKEWIAVERVH